MSQLDLSYYSKKDLPNILVDIELILTVFLPSFLRAATKLIFSG